MSIPRDAQRSTAVAATKLGRVSLPPTTTKAKASYLSDRLITAIAMGAYSPGEALPSERDLADLFDVSRDTVRAALSTVSELGLIETRRGRGGGNFVARAAWEDIAPNTARRVLEEELPRMADLYDFRCLVEGLIAHTAARRITDADTDAITAALDTFTHSRDMISARTADRQLHAAINAAAHNPHLTVLSAQLTVSATLGFGAEPYTEDFFAQAQTEHAELVDRVLNRDADGAQKSAERHFQLTLATMRASLEKARHNPVESLQ